MVKPNRSGLVRYRGPALLMAAALVLLCSCAAKNDKGAPSRPSRDDPYSAIPSMGPDESRGGEDYGETSWERFKGMFKKKEKEPPPVEILFALAESHYSGKETWYGKSIRKIYGPNGWAYKNFWWVRRKDYTRALELFQTVVDKYPFSRFAPKAELRMADCQFELDNLEEAAVLYDMFIKLHPRREEVPYAIYKNGVCHYERMLKPYRDQEETRLAAEAFSDLLARFPNSPYANKAKGPLDESRTRLAKHEMIVGKFYYRNRDYWAAAARYRGVWRDYPGLGFDEEAMFMEASCYDELGKRERAIPLYEKIIQTFPGGDYAAKSKNKTASPPEEPATPEQ